MKKTTFLLLSLCVCCMSFVPSNGYKASSHELNASRPIHHGTITGCVGSDQNIYTIEYTYNLVNDTFGSITVELGSFSTSGTLVVGTATGKSDGSGIHISGVGSPEGWTVEFTNADNVLSGCGTAAGDFLFD